MKNKVEKQFDFIERHNQFFERERELLISLPEKELFLSSFLESRKITSDCLISYNGNRYSVPHYFSGKEAWVTTYKGIKLYIYSQTKKLIAEHTIPKNKGNIVINKSHRGIDDRTNKS
ncbi:Mu transposase domain-containing protein [Thermodesulfobium narugense]|uniref:Mu transposase domain-containing protein n=1 Tax=Thermodesulfobium narugense TaxID=184064 RepID=UPI0002E30B14